MPFSVCISATRPDARCLGATESPGNAVAEVVVSPNSNSDPPEQTSTTGRLVRTAQQRVASGWWCRRKRLLDLQCNPHRTVSLLYVRHPNSRRRPSSQVLSAR